MKAHEFMVRQVYKVKQEDTVRTFIEKCIAHRISGMPVVNDRNEIVAYLSDGDIMRYIGRHEDLIVDSFSRLMCSSGIMICSRNGRRSCWI